MSPRGADGLLRLRPGEAGQRARHHERLAAQRSLGRLDRCAGSGSLGAQPRVDEPVQRVAGVLVAEEPDDPLGDHGADSEHVGQLLDRCAAQLVGGAAGPVRIGLTLGPRQLADQPVREVDRRRLPDVADPERVDDPAQRPMASGVDRGHEVLGALPTQSVQALERLGGQAEDVGRLLHELALGELDHDLVAEPVDVEPAAAGEVQQAAHPLRRAVGVRAALHHLALLAERLGAAHRAVRRHLPDGLGPVSSVDDRGDDLRNDLAGTLEDDRVADSKVLAPDLVDVVERRVAHGRPTDEDRGHVRDRGHRAGPPDVDLDLLELRRDLLGRELVRGRPARRAADEPELLPARRASRP